MTLDPTQIQEVRLTDQGATLDLLNLGCLTRNWEVPLGDRTLPVVLGYRDIASYLTTPYYMGVIVGPVANRLAHGRFDLDGQTYTLPTNEGPHLLHSGAKALSHRLWQTDRDGDRRIKFTLTLDHLEDGFPGHRIFAVTVSLATPRVRYEMTCRTDRPTLVNMAQHSYYAMDPGQTIHGQRLRVAASGYTPVCDGKLPLGHIAPLDGLPFDFRTARPISETGPTGVDLNFALAPNGQDPVAEVQAPNGLTLRMWSDQPGLQIYTGTGLGAAGAPLPGQIHRPFAGLCLEPQGFPDSSNRPDFPSIRMTPDRPYRQVLDVEIQETHP